MDNLVPCENCGHEISETAIRCPACWKQTGNKESLSKKLGMSTASTAAAILTGSAGVAAALVGGLFDFSSNRKLIKIAKKLRAIDFISLTDGILLFVTKNEFVPVLNGAGGPTDFPGFLRSDLHIARINTAKSKPATHIAKERTVLSVEYFDTNYRKKETKEEYKFKGKDSRMNAELALEKLKEYKKPKL